MRLLAIVYSPTAYAVNVYLQPSPKSFRLSRLSVDDVQDGKGQKMDLAFPCAKKRVKVVGKRRSRKEVVDVEAHGEEDVEDSDQEEDEEE